MSLIRVSKEKNVPCGSIYERMLSAFTWYLESPMRKKCSWHQGNMSNQVIFLAPVVTSFTKSSGVNKANQEHSKKDHVKKKPPKVVCLLIYIFKFKLFSLNCKSTAYISQEAFLCMHIIRLKNVNILPVNLPYF